MCIYPFCGWDGPSQKNLVQVKLVLLKIPKLADFGYQLAVHV